MEDLSEYTNLHRRKGRYYFRVRVPLDLVSAIGEKEIKKSLCTADLSEARHKLPIEQLKADELFSKTRRNNLKPSSENPAVETANQQSRAIDIETFYSASAQ